MRILALLALLAAPALAATVAPTVAHAQTTPTTSPPTPLVRPLPMSLVPPGWNITVGVAAITSPAWQGSRDQALSLFPNVRVAYSDILFASVAEGIGWAAVRGDGWRVGPLVKPRFGRNESNGGSPFLIAGGSTALIGMGNVKFAGEAGGFVEKQLGARRQWRLRGEVRQGFGGHQGVVADASVSYRTRLGRRTIANIGPSLTAAGSQFVQTYYGVDARQSLRTGLARYDAKGGIVSYGLGGTLIRPLDRRSAITLFSSLDRLTGPAADSPLVRERGRRTQFTLGLGYGFRFGL